MRSDKVGPGMALPSGLAVTKAKIGLSDSPQQKVFRFINYLFVQIVVKRKVDVYILQVITQ